MGLCSFFVLFCCKRAPCPDTRLMGCFQSSCCTMKRRDRRPEGRSSSHVLTDGQGKQTVKKPEPGCPRMLPCPGCLLRGAEAVFPGQCQDGASPGPGCSGLQLDCPGGGHQHGLQISPRIPLIACCWPGPQCLCLPSHVDAMARLRGEDTGEGEKARHSAGEDRSSREGREHSQDASQWSQCRAHTLT